ncbi:type II toxin-antitoxin system Phd/YefM family antitoxin [Caulobacter segnis]
MTSQSLSRDKGRPAAVLMSIEDFASYEETRYLLRSPRDAERLLQLESTHSKAAAAANATWLNETDLQRAGLGRLSVLGNRRTQNWSLG